MWMVYDWSEGLIGYYDTEEEAMKIYDEYKGSNELACDGEFYGDEDIVVAKVRKRFYSEDTGEPVEAEDDKGDTYWAWKEDTYNIKRHPIGYNPDQTEAQKELDSMISRALENNKKRIKDIDNRYF